MIPIVPATSTSSVAVNWLAPGELRLTSLPPLSLYVHLPWCVRKCPYCDFNSHEHADSQLPERAYVDALRRDLEASLPQVWGRRVHSVFIGGGTPSLFSAEAIDEILAMARALLPLEADAEVTLEANPGTFEAARFRDYRSAGINRLSLGVQSFDDDALRRLGRIHDARQARAALECAGELFGNFNLDLMYALPGQTRAQALADLKSALSYAPPHLSLYHLTIEPNTVFAKFPPEVPDQDSAAEMQDALYAELAVGRYERYEISAFARPGRRCQHNLNYWNFGDYLGIGAGAHSKLSFAARVVRAMRVKQPMVYLERAARGESLIFEESEVAASELPFEFMLNALRLIEGVPVARFAERTGLPLSAVLPKLEIAQQRGLIERDHLRLRATARGLAFLNDLQEIFLAD